MSARVTNFTRNWFMATSLFYCTLAWCFFIALCSMAEASCTLLTSTEEARILLSFKSQLLDEANLLGNWALSSSNQSDDACSWTGVLCTDDDHRDIKHVSGLNISHFGLQWQDGVASQDIAFSALCHLPCFTVLDLTNNSFFSNFPATLDKCTGIHTLSVSNNLFQGNLPNFIDRLGALRHLDLSYNYFSGSIPASFGHLPSLQDLKLHANLLNLTVPPFLGNLSNLKTLSLAYNPLSNMANIPPELGNLTELEDLWLAHCNLHGMIPASIGNLFKLSNLDLSQNTLGGEIHPSLMNLKSLIQLELYRNQLEGPIPTNIGNLTQLINIDISSNLLTGHLPASISSLLYLQSLHISRNHITGPFPSGLAFITSLTEVFAFSNNLSGALPPSLGAVSKLEMLDVYSNSLTGSLPPALCNRGALQDVRLSANRFTGGIPSAYAKCPTLQRVLLDNNQLSGSVPPGLWGSPALFLLQLNDNYLSGGIASEISNAQKLSTLRLDSNSLSGSLPIELFNLKNLTCLSLSNNHFSGTIPPEIGRLKHLSNLYIQSNAFSGAIPQTLALCTQLHVLQLADNQLCGLIPSSLGNLSTMTTLNLSHNKLSGPIPAELATLTLTNFDLSYNHLSGPIPLGFSNKAFDKSLAGNTDLCGRYKLCRSTRKKPTSKLIMIASESFIFAVAFVFLIGCILKMYRIYRLHRRQMLDCSATNTWKIFTFHKVQFEELDVVKCLDCDNPVLGSGGAATVYKAVLSNGQAVAIKKLNKVTNHGGGNDNREFDSEVATLGKIRHKHIVKLLCCCYNNDTRFLVYEYMPNGSLGDLMHHSPILDGSKSRKLVLDWPTRYGIALGAAEGLAYLHHDCSPPIVHRDIKSNNILLDAHLNAYIADFGIARLMERYSATGDECHYAAFTGQLAGTYGYIAPEHAYTPKATEKSDTYSFGVVLLEMVTGKRAVARDVFGEGMDIVRWVKARLADGEPSEVLDEELAVCWREGMLRLLRVALLCTRSMPASRPSMRTVVAMLLEVKPLTYNSKYTARACES